MTRGSGSSFVPPGGSVTGDCRKLSPAQPRSAFPKLHCPLPPSRVPVRLRMCTLEAGVVPALFTPPAQGLGVSAGRRNDGDTGPPQGASGALTSASSLLHLSLLSGTFSAALNPAQR